MTTEHSRFDDLLFLSMQLNQRAFAQPPVDGWLDAFLEIVRSRFPKIKSLQVVQVMGSIAAQIGIAGYLSESAATRYSLSEPSPVSTAIHSGSTASAPGVCVYPIAIANDILGALIVNTEPTDQPPSQVLDALSLQLGPAILSNHPQASQRADAERLMNRLTVSMQGKHDLQEVLVTALREMAELFGAQRASIRLRAASLDGHPKGRGVTGPLS